MPKINSNNVSLAGEFAVLAQLALRGYVANMTLGHTKGIDILVANPDTGRMRKIEVKTSQKSLKYGWVMSEKHERINDPDLFFCFVNITSDSTFRFFIVPSAEVADYLRRAHKQWADEKPSRKLATDEFGARKLDHSHHSRRLEMALTAGHIAPIVALIAGILILIIPRLLNYIVAIYLIVVGLIGLNGIYHFVN